MQRKYRGLRFIGLVLKIIGIVELAVGLVSILLFPLVFSDPNAQFFQYDPANIYPGTGLFVGILIGLIIFFFGIVCGLLTFSAGEIFNILIAIEENTRKTVQLMQEQEH